MLGLFVALVNGIIMGKEHLENVSYDEESRQRSIQRGDTMHLDHNSRWIDNNTGHQIITYVPKNGEYVDLDWKTKEVVHVYPKKKTWAETRAEILPEENRRRKAEAIKKGDLVYLHGYIQNGFEKTEWRLVETGHPVNILTYSNVPRRHSFSDKYTDLWMDTADLLHDETCLNKEEYYKKKASHNAELVHILYGYNILLEKDGSPLNKNSTIDDILAYAKRINAPVDEEKLNQLINKEEQEQRQKAENWYGCK